MFDKRRFFSKMCVFGISLSLLTQISLFASCRSNDNPTPTEKITVYDEDDEKEAYNDHGVTRGDLTYLIDVKFDAEKIENFSGEVVKLMRVQFPDQDCYLIAVVKTKANNGKLSINLGPIWFIEENGIRLDEEDEIQVSGSKLRANGRFVVLATDLSFDGKTLNIRDKEGAALWGAPKAQKGNADCMKITPKS